MFLTIRRLSYASPLTGTHSLKFTTSSSPVTKKCFNRQHFCILSKKSTSLCASVGSISKYCMRTFAVHAPTKWEYDLESFGELVIRSSQNCQFNIAPIDPVGYPNQNRAIVSHSKLKKALNVSHEKNLLQIVDLEDTGGRSRCDIRLPIKYNIDVRLSGRAATSISNMESQSVLVHAQYGHCVLHNLKTAKLDVHSDHGTIISEKMLQANGQITATNRAGVRINKPVGERLAIMSQRGDIRLRNVYVSTGYLMTETGCMYLGQCHKNLKVDITEKGNLTIDSMDGFLTARINEGFVDVFISRCDGCRIEVFKGDILVKIPDNVAANLQIEASKIVIDQALPYQSNKVVTNQGMQMQEGVLLGRGVDKEKEETTGPAKITLIAHSGTAEIRGQSWLSSIKFGSSPPAR